MNAFTVTQSWLLLIGAIVLAAVIIRLPLLINDYRYKRRRKKQRTPPVWFPADKYASRDGHLFFIGEKTPEQ
ncbi:hypothetical protein FPT84_13205 [Salmonella enterica]|uniref:Uncharacterized protein n=1 Tax=Salmonella enterica I TaxID=59201 RepID=A0A5U3G0F3_SALET|nr:hypothetical protein [Salmonella enterica]EBH9882221.1 hypothetical protein [Salmonella enterica subsp. enterica serovar Kisarawe]EBP4058986.1 hypothetical protein [Salmonella enterica subsp. enterica]AXD45555.1 hypothetical protein CHD70_26740 [Salmonella enterica]EAS5876544.1 hypothetical protein [Salmonella enterica]EAT8300209.1 hypothetical protein [Salmonella enterica]